MRPCKIKSMPNEEGVKFRMGIQDQYHMIATWLGVESISMIVTLCVSLYWNSDPYFPSFHFRFQRPLLHLHYFSIPNSNLIPLIHLWNSVCLTLTILPVSYPFPVHPDRRFHNPVSDLLTPPCCTRVPALFSGVIKASHQ